LGQPGRSLAFVPVEPPPSLVRLGAAVAARVDALLAAEERRWAAVDPDLVEPIAALRALAAGGKRLRPAFCHWGWVGAGGDPADPRVVDAGAALELLHCSAIVHDDVMDGSAWRRSRPCVHVGFSERHAVRDWRGEARRFGDGAAILVGDLAFVYADHLLRGAPAAAFEVFDDMRLELNIGQYLDLVGTAAGGASVDRARVICVYKSGKYTVERPLHLGAALAGRLDELAKPYSGFGVPLGEAFQLRDDLLGAFGDAARLGKAVGEDLREGKPTALYALARAVATGGDAEILDRCYGHRDLGDAEAAEIRRIMVDTGARAEVEATVSALTAEALAALDEAPITDHVRTELAALARFVADRDR
jgi:geranylgeranyl diphosphate synthase type I